MEEKSLAEYLRDVCPSTPHELGMASCAWMQYRIMQMCADKCQQIVKELVDELIKWLNE